ncbi:MAG: MBL fold metallo-hydrolase [Candidatus Schekmanbacteria bacterium]|nr:MAG: MBL fold metallo-hydrolase [Candidatus Schekmanbacteria bacterium]
MENISEIKEKIFFVKGSRSNIFLVSDEDLVLIDTGMPGDYKIILDAIKQIGRSPNEISHILITHAHMDHIGSLAKMKAETGAKIVAAQTETDFIEGRKKMWTMGRTGIGGKIFKMIMFFMENLVWNYEPTKVDMPCEGGELIDCCGGIEVISTPGHSRGSLSYYFKSKKAIFVGDSLSTMPNLRLPLKAGCEFYEKALESVKEISRFPAEMCFVGHGNSVTENAANQIKALLE